MGHQQIFFMERVARPRAAGESPSLEAFNRREDVALRDMAQRWDSVGQADGWTWWP